MASYILAVNLGQTTRTKCVYGGKMVAIAFILLQVSFGWLS